ncbi:hypothetical protein [Domibacillus mangrovi]|uniref:hypothetical protein n=1 Tax=Domibacillus mangrovi TaxID=1714354 RepID=UPI001FE4460E|nr:hypothetical protein [Domibacillus mangrovi]
MKQLKVTNTHGSTVEKLKEYERTLKNASSLKRVMAVRFVMEGCQGLGVARSFMCIAGDFAIQDQRTA